jgi:hypothetical protein
MRSGTLSSRNSNGETRARSVRDEFPLSGLLLANYGTEVEELQTNYSNTYFFNEENGTSIVDFSAAGSFSSLKVEYPLDF